MPALLVALALLMATAAPIEQMLATRTIVIRGIVTDSATGKALGGTHVQHWNGGQVASAVIADATGRYELHVSIADADTTVSVRARRLGYAQSTRSARILRDTAVIDIALSAQAARLEEVVTMSADAKAAPAALQMRSYAYGAAAANGAIGVRATARRDFNTEEYQRIEDNRFLAVASAPLSTLSVDVDRASYTNVRRYIGQGTMPPKDAVRIEELLNYFPYAYAEPQGPDPVSITTDVTSAPWSASHRIVRIGLQTQRIRTEKLPPSNLVFLLDVSGSMAMPNKLPLVKQAFRLLVNELREQDRVAIVVYAGNAGLVLPSTPASDKETILDAIERLDAGGSTAGGAGIKLAYDVARQNLLRDGNNRVILATDGDFNVGVSSTSELERLVEERRKDGTFLTVLGFGMGNYKDNRLETLADKGNGNYAYIDDLLEARKMFVHEFGGTMVTVAKDVKLQVEFNPAVVQAYRLIGYENRLLRNEDFTNDAKDAGDMGAGHSVTALYDIIPVGITPDVAVGKTDSLRYQRVAQASARANSKELLFVNVRYKNPKDSVSRLLQHPVLDTGTAADDDLQFALAVAEYGMLLRDSEFKGGSSYEDVLARATRSAGDDRWRNDFVTLVQKTQQVARGVARR